MAKFVIIKNRYEVLFEFENRYVVLEYVTMRELFVVPFRSEKLPDAVEVGVAPRAWRAAALKTVSAKGEGVELGLNAHCPHLLPAFH